MTSYGELVEESSVALADDEEYDGFYNLGLILEKTASGEIFARNSIVESSPTQDILLCLFEGKVALGFGEGFIGSRSNELELLGNVFITGNDGTVDSLMSRNPKRRPVARIYCKNISTSKSIIFVLIDKYGLPRSLVPEVTTQIGEFLSVSKQVVVFYTEPSAYFKFDKNDADDKLFYVKSSVFDEIYLKEMSAFPLPKPNIVAGVGASVALHCELVDKPSVLFISYHENDLVDSISLSPFFRAVRKSKNATITSGINIGEYFAKLVHNIKSSVQSNLHQASDLYL